MAAPAAPPRSAPQPPTLARLAAAPAGLVVARWTYVDEHHLHEVHAGLRPGHEGARAAFVVKESAFQNEQSDEVVEEIAPLDAPWEAQLHHWQLECRLSTLGRYWRHDTVDGQWRPLTPPQGRPDLDLREVLVHPYRGRIVLYHFRDRAADRDKLLVAIPNASPAGKRYLLATADMTFPNGEDAHLELLHAHLPEAPAKSVIVREHMALRNTSWAKLSSTADFERAHGAAWAREATSAYADILRRISEGRFGSPRKPSDLHFDPVYTDFVRALTDPRLLAMQAQFLSPEEQETALASGEPAIRRLIAQKRTLARPEDQHKLTLVEASLVARDQLRPGQRVDPEISALVRRFAFYL